ncbi:hypothetical protein F4775DRAFT_479397 [Biscogniauxia sp. FL1348]|nr:hypothetical protein F4775DRAFT_479397 [Biscogniauxia sp. FL1348]
MDSLAPVHGSDSLPVPAPVPYPVPDPAPDTNEDEGDSCWRLFLGLGPIWLVLYLTMAIYSIDYGYLWTILLAPQETNFGFGFHDDTNLAIGVSLLVISAILKTTWVGAWVQCLVITWFCDLKWKPKFPFGKSIMQVDERLLNYVEHGSAPYHDDRRLHRCPKGCDFDLTDRVYHCTAHGRCLPVYDHYCKYLRVIIYLRTMKPYLYVLIFLPLDGLFTVSLSIFALQSKHQLMVFQYVAVLILSAVMVTLIALGNTYHQIRWLALQNATYCERTYEPWNIAFKFRNVDGEWHLHPQKFYQNPWDLGPRQNLLQVFGDKWYQWLFFWWAPDRVYRYGCYADRDLPYADHVLRSRTLYLMPEITGVTIDPPLPSLIQGQGRSRRRLARSSGFRRTQQRSGDDSAPQAEASTRRRTGTDRESDLF